jgi:hypothetical protein
MRTINYFRNQVDAHQSPRERARANVHRALLRAVASWIVATGMTSRVHAFDAREGGSCRIFERWKTELYDPAWERRRRLSAVGQFG